MYMYTHIKVARNRVHSSETNFEILQLKMINRKRKNSTQRNTHKTHN